jgi:hypothetical protein
VEYIHRLCFGACFRGFLGSLLLSMAGWRSLLFVRRNYLSLFNSLSLKRRKIYKRVILPFPEEAQPCSRKVIESGIHPGQHFIVGLERKPPRNERSTASKCVLLPFRSFPILLHVYLFFALKLFLWSRLEGPFRIGKRKAVFFS